MSTAWTNVETNRPEADLTTTVKTDCTFDSVIPMSLLPDTFNAADFSETEFIYDTFGFANTGSGSVSWALGGYDYGMLGSIRDGIGFFYFYTSIAPPVVDPTAAGDAGCYEADFPRLHFWDYISTFWNFLDDPSRDMVENMWYGMVMAGGALAKKAARFLTAVAPTTTDVCVFDDYYDLQVGPMLSRPIFLNPTQKAPKSIINPVGTILVEPEYVGFEPSYSDLINITGGDYHKIRNLGVRPTDKIESECYVIVTPKNTDIDPKWFPVTDFKSSEEEHDRAASSEVDKELVYFEYNDGAAAWYMYSSVTGQLLATSGVSVDDLDVMGAIRLTGIDTLGDPRYLDLSQYKVTIEHGVSTAVAWGTEELTITVVAASTTQIDDIMGATPTGTPWATITNISPKGKDQKIALANNSDFEDLYNYVNSQEDGGRYIPPSGRVWRYFPGYTSSDGTGVGDPDIGEWVDSKAKYLYVIEIDGSLEYLGVEVFSIYLTNGKAYDINKEVIDLPYLDSGIETPGIQFRKEVDYTFVNYVLEFNEDPFVKHNVVNESYMYCKKTPIIENYLFTTHGGMVGVDDWTQYNYLNISGKAGLNTLQSALRNASSLAEYEKALNVYYGLPVAPEKSKVIGLYESYGYKIIDISGLTVTVEIETNEELHPFIQNNVLMVNDAGKPFSVSTVVADRTLGKMKLNTTDDLSYGDHLYVGLNNKFVIKNIYAATATDPPYLDVYVKEGYLPMKHVIDTVAAISKVDGVPTRYPEIIIHGTDKFTVNYDGLYHAVDAEPHPSGESGLVRIHLYNAETDEDPLYNDYISEDYLAVSTEVKVGYAHMPWPTHKFLYLFIRDSEKLYRAYMDAPMDTIYDAGDDLDQYQVICRNAAALNGTLFSTWNQYRNFRQAPNINVGSNIIEMIFADPSAQFGEYFPSRYLEAE